MRLRFLAPLAVAAVACGDSSPTKPIHPTDLGTGDTTSDMMPATTGGDMATTMTTSGAATIRVHYPGNHKMTLRGGAAPLDWMTGQVMTATGNDTYTYTFATLAAPVEWKPLLDDTTWAHGPNYHVAPGQTLDVYPHFSASAGKVTTLFQTFHSTVLNNDRTIYAYLPASYDENTDATYPVVYMHDGQNLFDSTLGQFPPVSWSVDKTFDAAGETGACSGSGQTGWGAQPLGGAPTTCTGDGDCASKECRTFNEAIVIAVSNTSARGYEYTPTSDPAYDSQIGPSGGGDKYLQFLVTELKPQVDKMLRTRPDVASTGLVGSSLGGLISAYGGLKDPQVFGLVGELSPSSWWNNDVIVSDVKMTPAAPMRPLRIYVDSGQGDGDDETDTDMLVATYVALGYKEGVDLHHVVQATPNGGWSAAGEHSEQYWAERFPGAMQFLLGTR